MNDMLDFFTQILGLIAQFLMTEPIKYFTAIFIGCGIVALIHKIIRW